MGLLGRQYPQKLLKAFDRPGGVLVDNVYPNSPSDQAGLEPGDVILAIDGKEIFDTQGLRYFIGLGKVGGETILDVLTGGSEEKFFVKLETIPEKPLRNIAVLKGGHIFDNLEVGNLSPAFSEELGMSIFKTGVVILDIGRLSPVRRLNVLRPGDIFETINDEDIVSVENLQGILRYAEDDISFSVRRSDRLVRCTARGRGSYSCR